jgi:hypothetical protein
VTLATDRISWRIPRLQNNFGMRVILDYLPKNS